VKHRTAVVVVACTALLAACGVPTGGVTTPIASTAVPYGLAEPMTAEPTSADPQLPSGVLVYFPDADLVLRTVPLDSTEASVTAVLAQLAAGPDATQRDQGLQSALGPDVRLTADPAVDGVVAVDVVALAQDPSADRLPVAVGQIVLSLTSVPGVRGVTLQREGQPREVPLPGGSLTSRVLTAQDYVSLTMSDPA
jgi:hypothetical protein